MGSALAIGIALIAGLAMAIQTPTNGSLGVICAVERATVVNFFGGWILLALLAATVGTGDLGHAAQAPWWQFLGGVYGVYIVLAVAAATPVLGVALTLMAVMFGQLTAGMVIDTFGLLDATRLPFNPLRAVGCLAVAVGIVFVYVSRWKLGKSIQRPVSDNKDAGRATRFLVLSLIAGVVSSMQSPTNTALSRHVGSIEASLVNFTVGLIFAFLALVVRCIRRKERLIPPRQVLQRTSVWQYLGGVYGMVIVVAAVVATPVIGVGLLMACEMFGQLAGGMVIDGFGLLRTPKVRLDGWRMGGVIWIALGIVLVALARL